MSIRTSIIIKYSAGHKLHAAYPPACSLQISLSKAETKLRQMPPQAVAMEATAKSLLRPDDMRYQFRDCHSHPLPTIIRANGVVKNGRDLQSKLGENHPGTFHYPSSLAASHQKCHLC